MQNRAVAWIFRNIETIVQLPPMQPHYILSTNQNVSIAMRIQKC